MNSSTKLDEVPSKCRAARDITAARALHSQAQLAHAPMVHYLSPPAIFLLIIFSRCCSSHRFI
eukprot:278774-Hanusia_phi.AAC.1